MKNEYFIPVMDKVEMAILQDEILVKFYESLKENIKEKKDIAQMDLIIASKKKEIDFNKNYVKFAQTL